MSNILVPAVSKGLRVFSVTCAKFLAVLAGSEGFRVSRKKIFGDNSTNFDFSTLLSAGLSTHFDTILVSKCDIFDANHVSCVTLPNHLDKYGTRARIPDIP